MIGEGEFVVPKWRSEATGVALKAYNRIETAIGAPMPSESPVTTAAKTSGLGRYYRCPARYLHIGQSGVLSEKSGYFRFGQDTLYGKCSGHEPVGMPTEPLGMLWRMSKSKMGPCTCPSTGSDRRESSRRNICE